MNLRFFVNTAFPLGNNGPKISVEKKIFMGRKEGERVGVALLSLLSASLSPLVLEKPEKQCGSVLTAEKNIRARKRKLSHLFLVQTTPR